MAGVQQALLVYPGRTLVFKEPFEKSPRVGWHLYNPTNRRIAYKVQTTSPPNFFVQPRTGILEASGRTVIYIQLRPCTKESLHNFTPKFKLIDFYIPNGIVNLEMDALWETMKPDECMKTTALVRFDISSGSQICIPDLPHSEAIGNLPSSRTAFANATGPSTSANNNVLRQGRLGVEGRVQEELVATGTGSESVIVLGKIIEAEPESTVGSQSDATTETHSKPTILPAIVETVDAAIQGDISDNGNVVRVEAVDLARDCRWWNFQGEFDCSTFWMYFALTYGSPVALVILGYMIRFIWNSL